MTFSGHENGTASRLFFLFFTCLFSVKELFVAGKLIMFFLAYIFIKLIICSWFQYFSHILTGVFTLLLTNPIWVAKTRLCLQYDAKAPKAPTDASHYRGMVDCLLKTYKYEGLRGLYKVNIF